MTTCRAPKLSNVIAITTQYGQHGLTTRTMSKAHTTTTTQPRGCPDDATQNVRANNELSQVSTWPALLLGRTHFCTDTGPSPPHRPTEGSSCGPQVVVVRTSDGRPCTDIVQRDTVVRFPRDPMLNEPGSIVANTHVYTDSYKKKCINRNDNEPSSCANIQYNTLRSRMP